MVPRVNQSVRRPARSGAVQVTGERSRRRRGRAPPRARRAPPGREAGSRNRAWIRGPPARRGLHAYRRGRESRARCPGRRAVWPDAALECLSIVQPGLELDAGLDPGANDRPIPRANVARALHTHLAVPDEPRMKVATKSPGEGTVNCVPDRSVAGIRAQVQPQADHRGDPSQERKGNARRTIALDGSDATVASPHHAPDRTQAESGAQPGLAKLPADVDERVGAPLVRTVDESLLRWHDRTVRDVALRAATWALAAGPSSAPHDRRLPRRRRKWFGRRTTRTQRRKPETTGDHRPAVRQPPTPGVGQMGGLTNHTAKDPEDRRTGGPEDRRTGGQAARWVIDRR